MSDERYDRSADMRLLDRQREALGIPAHAIHTTPDTASDPFLDAELGDDDEVVGESYIQSGTVLVATLDARPRVALVPGALVTVSLSVTNEGDAAAREVRMNLALPLDTAYRPGTLSIDTQASSDAVAQALFENGADLDNIGPGLRRTLTLQLLVEAGTSDVILTPNLSVASGAVLGLRAMRLTRRMPTVRGLVERPFYESDDAEHEVEPLEAPRPRPTIAVLQPREYPPAIMPKRPEAESPQAELPRAEPHRAEQPRAQLPQAESPRAYSGFAEPPPAVAPPPVVTASIPIGVATPLAPITAIVTAPLAKTVGAPIAKAVGARIAQSAPGAVKVSAPASNKPLATVPAAKTITAPGLNRAEMVARIVAEAGAKHAANVGKTAAGVITSPKRATHSIAESVAEVINSRTLRPDAESVAIDAPKRATEPKAQPAILDKPKRKARVQVPSALEPGSKKIARPKIEVVRSPDDRLTLPGRSGPLVDAQIDLTQSTLTGFFKGPSLDLIVDYLVLNALEARDPSPGDDRDGTNAALAASQDQLLFRALAALRLRKTSTPHNVGAALSIIAPALATVSVSIGDDGDAARKVRSCLTLPVDAAYRPGTLTVDAQAGSDAGGQALSGTKTLQLVIEAGANDVLLKPQLRTASGLALGLAAVRLEPLARRPVIAAPKADGNPPAVIEPISPEPTAHTLPEIAVTRKKRASANVAAKAAAALIGSRAPRPAPKSVGTLDKKHSTKPKATRASRKAPVSKTVAGPRIEVVRSTDDRMTFTAQGGPTLSVRIDRKRRSALKIYLCVALPVDTGYRPGTLSIDTQAGRDAIAQTLLTNGAELRETEAGPDRTLNLRLLIEPGTNDVMLAPMLSAASGAVLDLSAKRSTRRVPTLRGVIEPLEAVPPKAVADVVEPRPLRLVDTTVAIAENRRATEPSAEPAKIARPKVEVIRSTHDCVTVTGQGGPMLSVRIDRRRLSTLTGFFKGPSLGMIAHYLVLNALAARDPFAGDGADDTIAAFVASQEQLLSRALIAMRLGKTPTAGSVGAALPVFPPALAAHRERREIDSPPPGEAMLFRAFKPAEVELVREMLANSHAPPFMRAAQLFIGLCSNDAVVVDERERRAVDLALTAYASLATAEIGRIFQGAKSGRAPDLFKATASNLDDAAKAVLAAVARSIA